MNKKEFYNKLEEYGIKLDNYQIAVGYKTDTMYYDGVYKNSKNKWVVYEILDRNYFSIDYEGDSEEKAFSMIYDALFYQIDIKGYITKYISEEVIETGQKKVATFLKEKYKISSTATENIWSNLCCNFHVLNEVKYFARNNKFVPADDCYKVEGYSAQDIYEMSQGDNFSTYLTEIGAYNYLIYLAKHPEEALKNLKNGLPRK